LWAHLDNRGTSFFFLLLLLIFLLPLAAARAPMPPAARASSGASLDGLVFALAGRRVSPTAQKAWTDFARAHGGEVILASHAKWEGPRVTHVVLVDRPASKQALAAAVAALPKACRARRGFPEPAVVDKDWFVQSAKRKRALPLEAFAFKAESASEDATRGAAERAEPGAHAGDVVSEDASSKQNVPSAPYGTSEACLAMELRIARRSLERWRDELKKRDGGDARRVTREAFRDFAAEGFPGLVGRTHAARRILEEETFPSTSEARQHEVDAEGRFVSEQVSDRKRRRVAEQETSEKTKSAGEKTTRTTLLDLPDELLAACVSSLPLLGHARGRGDVQAPRERRARTASSSFGGAGGKKRNDELGTTARRGGAFWRTRRLVRSLAPAAGASRGAGDDLEPEEQRPRPGAPVRQAAGRGRGGRGLALARPRSRGCARDSKGKAALPVPAGGHARDVPRAALRGGDDHRAFRAFVVVRHRRR
jgi:hypothetical protein